MHVSEIAKPCHVEPTRVDHRLTYLAAYCDGWAQGDLEMIRAAVADGYVWRDPRHGCASKEELGAILSRLKGSGDGLGNGCPATSYFPLSGPGVETSQPTTTVWCGFAVPASGVQGISQIRVGDSGVLSEHRIHQTRPYVQVAGVRRLA